MTIQRLLILMLIASVMFVISIEIGMADEVNLTLEGHFGGIIYANTVSGSYAYIGQGQDFVVIDKNNPSIPLELSRLNTCDLVRDIKIFNSYAYVANWHNGLLIIDISDPSTPYIVGNYDTKGYANRIAVLGNYAYIADWVNGFVIVDISDSSTPYLAGHYDTAGCAHGIAVSGSYAYVADFLNGLVIVDISNPSVPYLAGNYDTIGYALDITVSDNYAYVADRDNGLVIIDISDPLTPYLAGHYDTAGNAYSIVVLGNYAYVADGDNGLVIIDISDPLTPYLAGHYNTVGWANSVAVSGSYAYVADGGNGLVIVDISNLSMLYLAGNYDIAGNAWGISVSGNYAYVADGYNGLVIVDISDPSTPYLAGHYDTKGSAFGVVVSDNYAYVADRDNGLVIVDISDPSTPYLAGHYNTVGWARSIAVSDSYAYVVDGYNGLVIIDISDPLMPYFVGHYDTVGYAFGIAVSDNYAYVADYDNGLVIVDISDPSTPYLSSHYDTIDARSIAISDNYAYVADGYNGLVIVNINDPLMPYFVGHYDTVGEACSIAVSVNYAYIVDWVNGLVIVNISNPSIPYLAGHYDTAGYACGIAVSGNYAYVADLHNELVILRINWPSPEINRSRLGINTHWNHWAENFSIYQQKIKGFGIVRDQAWWAGLETSDLTGSEWDQANWYYSYDTETLCDKEITYQSGLDNLVKLYQDEKSPELLLLLNLKNEKISSFETITADQYYDYVYHVVERYDGDGIDDMPGLIRPVKYFEVGNEVDYIRTGDSRHGYLSPEDYVKKRLIPAYNAAKTANENAVIMGSGLGMGSDLWGNDGKEFNTIYLDALYDNITKNGGNKNNNYYMDKIAIHYYAKPNAEFDDNIKKVEDVIQKYESREKPVWITEFYPLTEIGSCDTTTGAFARLLTLMFANRIEIPVIYNLKDDSEESYGLYNVSCEGDEETLTSRESIQVIDTVLSTLHGTTPFETENKDISVEPGKTTYQRVFNNSEKKVTVLWYIDTADPSAVSIFPEVLQTFTVDVLGTANFSIDHSPIHLKIGSEPTYVIEADLPVDVDLYFNKTTTTGVSTKRATSFRVGDTLYGKIETSISTDHIVKTYITMTLSDGTCKYAYYDKPDFDPECDDQLFSDTRVPLYDGVWHAATNDWLWNIYEFTGGDSGSYRWNCWYEDAETGEILGGNATEYTFSATPSGTPVDSSTGRGEVYFNSNAGILEDLSAILPDNVPEVPESLNPVYGFFSFNITGISSGQSVNIPLVFPENVPAGTEYWKYGPTTDNVTPHWYRISISDDDGDRVIVITLTDGGIGDDDLTANGVIVDDGGPSLSMTKKGDLNHDGNITSTDVRIALGIVFRGEYSQEADMDGNGYVNILDVRMIMQAAAGNIEF